MEQALTKQSASIQLNKQQIFLLSSHHFTLSIMLDRYLVQDKNINGFTLWYIG